MSDDSDFDGHRGPGGPTTPSKKSPGKSKKRRSPTKLKVKETAADRAKKASIQARKQARLAAGLSARPGARLPTVSSYVDDPALLDPFARARAVLHVSATPEELPCRDDEAATIGAYLEEAIEEGSGSCLYIAGVPGTGKTATVHNLIRGLKQQARRGVRPVSSACASIGALTRVDRLAGDLTLQVPRNQWDEGHGAQPDLRSTLGVSQRRRADFTQAGSLIVE